MRSPLAWRTDTAVATYAKVLLVILATAAVFRLFLALNVPIVLDHTYTLDDGLFMRLAKNLAEGRWLGAYNQSTLAKGPGYPAFLAVAGLSGLPVSAAHGLFQVATVAVAAWVVLRLTASRTLAALTFLALAFHPVAVAPELQRVIREQIYWGQMLMTFSLFAALFYAPPRSRTALIVMSALAGMILAWAWLTREEGVGFLPALVALAGGALLINRGNRKTIRALVQSIAVAVTAFMAVNAAFMTANWTAYGSFVGVDIKERNFKAALDALQDVDTGPIIPYLPVPILTRSEVAKISPTFRPLSPR